MKYTTIPSSDAHDHCEYFTKQLVEQADRGGLTDDERKSLLGLKLSADKTPITLNAWWIAYSKTKGGEVICFKLSYSRQINLVDCANEYTRHLLASRGTNSLFLIKPAGYRSLGRILSALEGCHLALVKMRMIHIKTTDLPLSFCGPFDVHVARELAPTTLRGIYGHTNMQNAVHCTDSPEDGNLETQFFFRVLA
ncbi:hypothetical protein DYB37_013027 [Aphanomyces astaci]|uniref:Nucleoside diphosphate kinase-like domain-containing protein n=1 Tax=Aphanomyces astaci TaxID=112090 RepID=A0A418EBH3_APHAT|nr:hypothetical protein DYB37_013027 [Aphanomyces astaci]